MTGLSVMFESQVQSKRSGMLQENNSNFGALNIIFLCFSDFLYFFIYLFCYWMKTIQKDGCRVTIKVYIFLRFFFTVYSKNTQKKGAGGNVLSYEGD